MKTAKEIKYLRDVVKKVIDGLPEINSFGESNRSDMSNLKNIVTNLNMALSAQAVKRQDVEDWILNKPSDLNDFLL